MPHQTALPDALRRFGLTVELVPGWETRGSSTFTPRGSICHHTAGPTTGDRPSLNICVNGRSDLPGPLCNVFLTRAGVAVVVAGGRANHGGTGTWRGVSGNSMFFGTEAESAGQGDWTPAQLVAYPRVHAAYHSLTGTGADMCCAHREYATPAGRKPDPVGIDMGQFRAAVAALLTDGPQPTPSAHEEMPDMIVGQDQATGRLWLISGNTKLEFPAGGSENPNTPGHGNVYADELLKMIHDAYPGTNPQLVALNPDIVGRIPGVFSLIEQDDAPGASAQAHAGPLRPE